MLSVVMHKDVASYEPKIIGSLSLRSLVCVVAACAASVGVGWWFYFVLFGRWDDVVAYAAMVVAFPIFALGFWRPEGMKPEKFLPLWFEHKMTQDKLFYVSSFLLANVDGVLSLKQRRQQIFENAKNISKKYKKFIKKKNCEWLDYSDIK